MQMSFYNHFNLFVLFTCLFPIQILAECLASSQCEQAFNYTLFFEFKWSVDIDKTYPTQSEKVGFDTIICVSHNDKYQMWEPDTFATSQIVSLLGEKEDYEPLLKEIQNQSIESNSDGSILSYDYSENLKEPSSVHNLTLRVKGQNNYTKISCISKVIPSPGWFVGISSLDMCCESKFNTSVQRSLIGWDGGIDEGSGYEETTPLPKDQYEKIENLVLFGRNGYGELNITANEDAPKKVLTDDPQPSISPEQTHSCFPANQYIMLNNRQNIQLRQLETNQTVATISNLTRPNVPFITHNSSILTPSPIFLFTHHDPYVISNFIKLSYKTLDSSHLEKIHSTLTLSPGHYIYRLTKNGQSQLVLAKNVKLGDWLVGYDGFPRLVHDISSVYQQGLYNPQSLNGNLIVGGVLVSCYTFSAKPVTATALLSPLRLLYRFNLISILRYLSLNVPFSSLRQHIDNTILSLPIAN